MKQQQSAAVKFGDQVPNPLISIETQEQSLSSVVDLGTFRTMNTMNVKNKGDGLQY
jgi:hypothetical protein